MITTCLVSTTSQRTLCGLSQGKAEALTIDVTEVNCVECLAQAMENTLGPPSVTFLGLSKDVFFKPDVYPTSSSWLLMRTFKHVHDEMQIPLRVGNIELSTPTFAGTLISSKYMKVKVP